MKFIISILGIVLFSFQSVLAQTPAELKSWLPVIDGWTVADKVEVFDSENLFDRINGAAPLFIENNFREMTALEYQKGDDYITVQIYRHATPEDAFGMYASERSSDLKYFPIGGEAQGDDENFFFFAGNIYVKMSASASENTAGVLQAVAGGLAAKIDASAAYPALIGSFPQEGKQPYTEAYITSSYIGHEFLRGAYIANYDLDGQKFQAFIFDAKTKQGAKEILDKYFTFTKQSLDFDEGFLTIKDRYNGDIPVIWKGQYIIGLFSENGGQIKNANDFLSRILTSIK